MERFITVDNILEGMKLAENILSLCKEKGISLAQLSKMTGVAKTNLHAWTTGRKTLDLMQLKKVSTALQVSVHELVYGEPDPFDAKSETLLKEIFSGDVRVTLHRIERRRGSDPKS